MVCFRTALPIVATAYSALVGAEIIPGAFIFEFADNQDNGPVMESVTSKGNVRMKFESDIFQGVSVDFHDLDNAEEMATTLSKMPAVKQMWPVRLHTLPSAVVEWAGNPNSTSESRILARGKSTDTFEPHVMTQIDKLRAKGITGKGINVAVIDTGIDYKHPALGGCLGEKCLVVQGHDFVGDDFDGRNKPVPGDDPMDCQGHGTHVAGTIAAIDDKLEFTGGAPGVTLSAYRVFGCEGSASSDVLMAAMNRAYKDHANIITLSIGGPNGWKENAWAVAASRIVAKGVPVTISAGNEGTQGIFYASSGSSGVGVAAIAAYQNVVTPTLIRFGTVTVDGGKEEEFSYAPGSPAVFDATLSLLDLSAFGDGCKEYPDDTPDLSNHIVLIARGGCGWAMKGSHAAGKGAAHMLFYSPSADLDLNHDLELLNSGGQLPKSVKGIGMVEHPLAEAWAAQIKAGKKLSLTLGSFLDDKLEVKNIPNPKLGGSLSYFTTWGPTWTMDVKPQFGAPGGKILSTYPLAKGGYAVLSGTSMSCPLAASIYALMGEVRGTLDPRTIENLLAANANPQLFNDGARFYDDLAPVAQQGAGMIQAYDAAFATTMLEPSSISFNETTYLAKSKNFTLTNLADDVVTYEISYVASLTAMTLDKDSHSVNKFPGDLVKDSATITFSEDKVTLKKGEKVTVEVLAEPPTTLDPQRLPLWSGYVRINGTDGTALSLPYQGLVGSLRDHPVIDKDSAKIIKSDDPEKVAVKDNTVFELPKPGSKIDKDTVVPVLAFAPNLGSRIFEFHVLEVNADGSVGANIGEIMGSPNVYNPRTKNSLRWFGLMNDKKFAPEGTYIIAVKGLRLYGDENKSDDWDIAASQPFTIKYV